MRCVSSSEISMGSDSREFSLDTLSEHALILREHEVLDECWSCQCSGFSLLALQSCLNAILDIQVDTFRQLLL
eukprot:182898-Pleurochrysis_carterae.AAC.1